LAHPNGGIIPFSDKSIQDSPLFFSYSLGPHSSPSLSVNRLKRQNSAFRSTAIQIQQQQQQEIDRRKSRASSFAAAMTSRKMSLFNRWKNQSIFDTALEGISEEEMFEYKEAFRLFDKVSQKGNVGLNINLN
jgi:hypothetical protein